MSRKHRLIQDISLKNGLDNKLAMNINIGLCGVTLDNWFSGLDARALQSGLQRFCEFFRGEEQEQEDTSVLVH